MPHYKLIYFPTRGRGELIRLILQYAKQPYENVIVKHDEDWSKIKPTFLFGQLPVLEVDGKQIAQSHAIARYLARQYNLAGANDFETAQIDAIADQYKDFEVEFFPYLLAVLKNDESEMNARKENALLPAIDKFLPIFEKLLKESSSGFFAKSGVTWADFVVANGLHWIKRMAPEALSKYKLASEHIDRVHNLPEIKDYIATRPETKI